MIGAITQKEYRKYIQRDAALSRRFSQVEVPEPTERETWKSCRGFRGILSSSTGYTTQTMQLLRQWSCRDGTFPSGAGRIRPWI